MLDAAKTYERYARLVRQERLPAALVDLDAVDHNVAMLVAPARAAGKSIRIATKSIRCVALIEHLLARGAGVLKGLMAYDAREVGYLVDRGFDDVLLAYPVARLPEASLVAEASKRAGRVSVVVDCREHLDVLEAAAKAAQTRVRVVIDVDMSVHAAGGAVHLGVLRSPLRSEADVLALADEIARRPALELVGLMGYEAQIAGLADRDPRSSAMGQVRRLVKAVSEPHVARLRASLAAAFARRGQALELFNGGGSGSVHWAAHEPHLTELAAGSGFLGSHLFDHYDQLKPAPAIFFALAVARAPGPGLVTCAGGGYIASGPPAADRLPLPSLPEGLTYVDLEGAGEVQTPLRVPVERSLRPGDPVFFRHAKAGELAERFDRYLFVRGADVVARATTYRGDGGCFL